MENIITYEMLIDDELIDGVYAISLVDSPAIKSDFIMLSEQKELNRIEIKLQYADNMRHVVTGLVLVPDMLILRIDEKTNRKYNITFSADTIRQISENFMIQNKKDNVTLQHKMNVNKINLIESWIVDDPKMDKITKLGIEAPAGSWAVSYKINDDALWAEYLKTGYLKGFSLEGNFSEKEIKLEDDIDVHLKDIFLALYYTEEDLDQQYKWKLGPETAERKNCPACKEHAGKIKTLREWIDYAMPTIPNGTVIAGLTTDYTKSDKARHPFGTFCAESCGCELVKVLTTKRGATIIKPW